MSSFFINSFTISGEFWLKYFFIIFFLNSSHDDFENDLSIITLSRIYDSAEIFCEELEFSSKFISFEKRLLDLTKGPLFASLSSLLIILAKKFLITN